MSKTQLSPHQYSTNIVGRISNQAFCEHEFASRNELVPQKSIFLFHNLNPLASFRWSIVMMILMMGIGGYSKVMAQTCITTYQPVSLNVAGCEGSNENFRINYGSLPSEPTVVWQYNDGVSGWLPLSGSPVTHTITNNFGSAFTRLTVNNTALSYDGYQFRAVFSGSCTQTSNVFTLDVNSPVTVLTNPSDASACATEAGPEVFTASTSGAADSYLWQYSPTGAAPWTNIGGSNNTTLNVANPSAAWPVPGISEDNKTMFIRMRATVTGCGNIFSDAAEFRVDKAPIVTVSDDVTICSSDDAELTATMGGSASSVTWSGTGTFSPDNITNPVTYSNASAGTYTITATTNANGECAAATADVDVTVNILSIDSHTPVSLAATRCAGQSQTFTVSVTSIPTATYQWQVSTDDGATWNDIDGEESASLNLTGITAGMDGNQYQCVVSAGDCSLDSDAFTLNVDGPIAISTQPTSVTDICITQDEVTFSVVATTGSGTLSYQWQQSATGSGGWSNISGEDEASLTVENTDPNWPGLGGSYYYRVQVDAGVCAPINSSVAELGVSAQGPVTVNAGSDAMLCEDGTTLALGGTVSPINVGTWSSDMGGTFSDANAPTTSTFTPAAGFTGDVTLTLTSYDPVGNCPVVTDEVVITVVGVNAGVDLATCFGDDPLDIEATISGTVDVVGQWSSSTGAAGFGDVADNATTYTADAADEVETLIFTHIASGCSDELTLTVNKITLGATTPANKIRTVCEGGTLPSPAFRQNRTTFPVSNGNTDVWEYSVDGNAPWVAATSLSGVTVAGNNSRTDLVFANTIPYSYNGYNFRVTITEGECTETVDGFVLVVNQAPTLDAGMDQTVCFNDGDITLTPVLGGAAMPGSWTGGSGSFSGNVYTPGLSDAGTEVTFTYTTNDTDGAGPCSTASDMVDITFDHVTIVSYQPASLLRDICEGGNTNFRVNYSSNPTASVVWEYRETPTGDWEDASILGTISSPGGNTQFNLVGVTTGQSGYQFRVVISAGTCDNIESDVFTLTVGANGTIDAGTAQTICVVDDEVNISGTLTGGYVGVNTTWTSSSGNNAGFGNQSNLATTYLPSSTDITNGTVTLTITTANPPGGCGVISDNVVITLPANPASLSAGADGSVCAGSDYDMDGSISLPVTSATWTSTGTGTFFDPLSPGSTPYTPSAADIAAGEVQLILTSNNLVSGCNIQDTMTLTIETIEILTYVPASKVVSTCDGEDVTFAVTTETVTTPTYEWYKRLNNGIPEVLGNNDLSYTFTATAADSGYVYYMTVDAAGCMSTSDSFRLNVNGPITISAQPSNVGPICNSTTEATFTSGATSTRGVPTYQWQYATNIAGPYTNIVGYDADTDELNLDNTASFWPSLGATVYVRMEASVSDCDPVYSDPASLSVDPNGEATVNAGSDISSTCNQTGFIQLAGSFTPSATSAMWSTSGSGTFNDVNVVNARYTPSNADRSNGSVILTLTTNDPPGLCPAVSDQLVITFNNVGTIDAGADMTVCSGAAPVPIVGVNTNAPAGSTTTWSTSGTGTFASASSLSTTYSPSPADRIAGIVTLTLTRNVGTSTCPSIFDTKILTISNTAGVTAGSDQTICFGGPTVLGGNFTAPATSITWTIASSDPAALTGSFADANDPDTQFTPNSAGIYTLQITSNGPLPGACPVVSDQVKITVTGVVASAPSASSSPAGTYVADTRTITMACYVSGTMTATFTSNMTETPSSPSLWTYTWQRSTDGGSNWNDQVGTSNTGTYAVTVTPNMDGNMYRKIARRGGCTTVEGLPVTLRVNGRVTGWTTTTAIGGGSVCSNTNPTTKMFGGAIPTIPTVGPNTTPNYIWEYQVAGSGPWIEIAGSTTSPLTINNTDPSWPAIGTTNGYRRKVTFVTPGLTNCVYTSGSVTFTITNGELANAGVDQTICQDGTFTLTGSVVAPALAGVWSIVAPGDGTILNPNAYTNTTYTPGPNAILAGTVTLRLTTTTNGLSCGPDVDDMVITIGNGSITGNSNLAPTRCSGANATFTVNFSSPSAQIPTIEWQQNGVPVFGANFVILDSGSSTQTRLRVNDVTGLNGDEYTALVTYPGCAAETRTFTLTVLDGPTANVGGPYAAVCSDDMILLDGIVGGSATTGTWSSASGGTFSDVDLAGADATYTPSGADITVGSVVLTLTSNGAVPGCPLVPVDVTVNIHSITPNTITPATQTQCDGEVVTISATWVKGVSTPDATATWEVSTDGGTTYLPFAGTSVVNSVGQSVLTFTATSAMSGNKYRAVVAAGACTVSTSPMTLTVNGPVVFDTHPASVLNECQSTTEMSFTASGTNNGNGAETYRWQYSNNGTSWTNVAITVDGYNTTTLTVDSGDGVAWPVIGNATGKYYRLVANLTGCTNLYTSNTAQFTISDDDAPIINSVPADATQCVGTTVSLSASIDGVVATSATWSHDGTGTIDLPANFGGATYTPGVNETGDVVFTLTTNNPAGDCPAAVESFTVTYINVNAGADINVCVDGSEGDPITLAGSVAGIEVPTVLWTTSGTGTFNDDTALDAMFSTVGSETLTLTAYGCTDNVDVIFNTNFSSVALSGAVVKNVCVGSGTTFRVNFEPNDAAVVRTWQFSADGNDWNDLVIAAPFSVTSPGTFDTQLNLLSTGANTGASFGMQGFYRVILTNGDCSVESDQFTLNVSDVTDVSLNDGDALIVCESALNATAMATATTSGSGSDEFRFRYRINGAGNTWFGAASASPTLTISSGPAWDNALFSSGNTVELQVQVVRGGCTVLSDWIAFSRIESPLLTVPADITLCENSVLDLTTSTANIGITWSADIPGGSFSPDVNTEAATYTPPADYAGDITITMTADDAGNECGVVTESMTVSYEDAPVANAGEDQAVCQTSPADIQLNGSVSGGAISLEWSNGAGTFDPDVFTGNALYEPSGTEITNQTVTLILTAIAADVCPNDTDEVIISLGDGIDLVSFTPNTGTPTVAGTRTVCSGGNTTLSVEYDATLLATLQWQINDGNGWINLPVDATSYGIESWNVTNDDEEVTLSLIGLTGNADGLQFQVVVTDRGCTEEFGAFTLVVNGPLTFTTQPENVSVCESAESANFSAVATNGGAGTITYQWQYFNGSWVNVPNNIAGYNGPNLFLTNTASFWPAAGNSVNLRLNATVPLCGTTTSNVATLTRTNVSCDALIDLIPTNFITSGTGITAGQSANVVMRVLNTGSLPTTGIVQFRVYKMGSTFSVGFNNALTSMMVGFVNLPVTNTMWTIDSSNPLYHTITSNAPMAISPTGFVNVGFTITATGTPGLMSTLRQQITPGTGGGETPSTNNNKTLILTIN